MRLPTAFRAPRRVLCALLLAALPAWLAPAAALAQAYPNKPVRIIVPFAPGGAVDAIARLVGQRLSEQMGQPLIIENHPGASANLGAEMVAKAAPDGYTLLMGANGLATNVTLFPKLSFDALKDFAPVARIGEAPVVLVVANDSPLRSLGDLLAAARKEPGKLTYASAGNGSSNHLAGELLKHEAHIDALHVPYKGGAPALTDLLGGRISYMLLNTVEVLPQIHGGRLRALAIASPQRIALFKDVPTMREAGLPGYEASVWWGLVAPAHTPAAVVGRLNAETNKALAGAALHDTLDQMGVVATPGSPAQFGAFLKTEAARWGRVIRAANIQAD
jgi:tripartite-type tricarboxylate transporter receptor subunit TctC